MVLNVWWPITMKTSTAWHEVITEQYIVRMLRDGRHQMIRLLRGMLGVWRG
jgi:hypothetical protein